MTADRILQVYEIVVFLAFGTYVAYTQWKFYKIARKYSNGQPFRIYQISSKDLSESDRAKVKDWHLRRIAVFILIAFLMIIGFIIRSLVA